MQSRPVNPCLPLDLLTLLSVTFGCSKKLVLGWAIAVLVPTLRCSSRGYLLLSAIPGSQNRHRVEGWCVLWLLVVLFLQAEISSCTGSNVSPFNETWFIGNFYMCYFNCCKFFNEFSLKKSIYLCVYVHFFFVLSFFRQKITVKLQVLTFFSPFCFLLPNYRTKKWNTVNKKPLCVLQVAWIKMKKSVAVL